MNKAVSPPSHSLSKRDFKRININESKTNIKSPSKNKPFTYSIPSVYNSLYEDLFPYILKISKASFFEKLDKQVDEIFILGKMKNNQNLKIIIECKEKMLKKYDSDYKLLLEEFNNFLKNPKNYNYLTHFRKHCIQTDFYALHYCSPSKNGKFIEIRNKASKNKEVLYVICESCKQCFLSKFILMLCPPCNRKYYSNILLPNENANILPATWKKYHCSSLINAIMKCINCKNILYLNLATKYLVCLNKKCNFTSKQGSILWTCNVCSQEFRSLAKIYNPLEFQILKKSINFALLKKIRAAPRELPCNCTKDLSKLVFYHKEGCRGELYKGILIDKPIIVCSKCHAINFEEKFTWICPICSTKFHLHTVKGCRPFSKKKYVINKHYNKSITNSNKKKAKDLANKINNVVIYNPKENNLNKSDINMFKPRHSKLLSSEDFKDQTNNDKKIIFKKIEPNKRTDLKRYEYTGEELINLKTTKNKNNKSNAPPKRGKYHTTLIEILQKRMLSQSRKMPKTENEKINKSMLPEKRIKNHNIVKRRKENPLYESANTNYMKKKTFFTNKNEKKEVENTENKNPYKSRAYRNINISEIKSGNRSVANSKYRQKISPIMSDRTKKKFINEENKNESNNTKEDNRYFRNKEKYVNSNISYSNMLKTNSHINNLKSSNNRYIYNSATSAKNINNNSTTNSASYRRRKDLYNSSDSKMSEMFRFSKVATKIEPETSYIDNNNDLRDSTKFNINSINSSFRISLAGNNALNNTNYNNAAKNSYRYSNYNMNNDTNNNSNNTKDINKDKKENKEIFDKENSILYSEKSYKNDESEDKIEKKEENLTRREKEEKEEKKEKEEKEENENKEEKEDEQEIEDKEDEQEIEDKKVKEEKKEKEEDKNRKEELEKIDKIEKIEKIEKKEEDIDDDDDEDYDKIEDIEELISKLKKRKRKLEQKKLEENNEKDKFNESDIYESKEISSYEEEENKDKVKDDLFFNFNKKNVRESLVLKTNFRRQSILISQEKLNNIAIKTDIPSIEESDYTYLKPIGEGTYGLVYLVENNKTSEQYALKKIVCRDYNELIKQKSELELLFSVKHEHILNLLGVQFKYLDETTSAIYVLMELAQNDWNQEIKRRLLAKRYYKENELINILKQIIKGFLFLQEKNIAHRDIKPQNILLFPNNVYKIADFGEAKFIKSISERSTLKGSELYMSPLLYKGYKFNQHNVLHNPFKSDMFSLGYCLLYAMCLNLSILNTIRELTTMKSIMTHVSKYIAQNKYSEKLMNIIYKMIEPNEDLRLDFEDLAIELDKI